MTEQSEDNNHASKINVFTVWHTTLLQGGRKTDIIYDPLVEKIILLINFIFVRTFSFIAYCLKINVQK